MANSDRELLQAVRELRDIIFHLTEQLKEYPLRTEVEARFTTKKGSWRRFWFALLIVLLTAFSTFFLTMSTVSACFLDELPHPSQCSVIPGYDQTLDSNEELLKMFNEMRRDIKELKERRNGA